MRANLPVECQILCFHNKRRLFETFQFIEFAGVTATEWIFKITLLIFFLIGLWQVLIAKLK